MMANENLLQQLNTKVNGRQLLKRRAEKIRTGIYVKLNAKGRSFVYLVFMFIKLIFRQSNIICIGPFISSDSGVTYLAIF